MELEGIELIVAAALGEELMVRALLDYLAVAENNNIVRMLDGGKTVSDDEHRTDIHHLFKRILDEKLGFGIYIGGGFVENHDARLVEDCACEGKQLTLTCGEVVAAFTNDLVKPAFKLVDEAVRVDVTAGSHDLFIGDALFTQKDIAPYRISFVLLIFEDIFCLLLFWFWLLCRENFKSS